MKAHRFVKQAAVVIFIPVVTVISASAQQLPIIKANNKLVDIKDGNQLLKKYWTITPEAKPDVYITSRINQNKKVTFYTDIDSITFTVKPGAYIPFNILLNNKDTAPTAIYSFDTLATLQRAGTYNYAEKRELPSFTYQSFDNPHLVELRKAFNLDSIAGEGNEVSKILNLLHWIHNLIPHDGNHDNPEVKNAMSMIAVCKKDKRGLNCRGLATVLNECYLSMNIKSRFITCYPKDSIQSDNDCHVINMVYSNDLKKWLWIDPTNDAYVMNEKGELLSIEEVRQRIINNKILILNPEANWNHKASMDKRFYLYSYMSKNLYILETPLSSEYDTETKYPGKSINYVSLIPLDYHKKSLEKSVSTNKENKVSFVTYKTNNPSVFWQSPK